MLRQKITDGMKDAMRAKDERGTATLRMVMAKIKDLDIAARPKGNADGIGNEEIQSALQGMIKQRRESIALYEKGNRPDLVKQESEEIAVIERFLPRQLTEDEVKAAVSAAIASTGAASIKDMGKVVGALKKDYAGQMDFAQASAVAKGLLGG